MYKKYRVRIDEQDWVEDIPLDELEGVPEEDREAYVDAWIADSVRVSLTYSVDELDG